jgi:hypothetical protein
MTTLISLFLTLLCEVRPVASLEQALLLSAAVLRILMNAINLIFKPSVEREAISN